MHPRSAAEWGTWNSEIRYTAFGEVRYSSGITPTDYRYTGQLSEAETGLYFYVSRWYDPALARFIQPDTIVPGATNPQAWNRYSYVANNPILLNDPTGHFSDSELADLMGYGSVDEMYNSDWWNWVSSVELVDLLHEAEMGDIVTFEYNHRTGATYSMMFCGNGEGGLSFLVLEDGIAINEGLGFIATSDRWALFTREDKRFFDDYNPSLINHKGESLDVPDISDYTGSPEGSYSSSTPPLSGINHVTYRFEYDNDKYGELLTGVFLSVGLTVAAVSAGQLLAALGSGFTAYQCGKALSDSEHVISVIPIVE